MSKIGFIIATVFLAAVLVLGLVVLFSGSKKEEVKVDNTKAEEIFKEAAKKAAETPPAELKIETLKQGTGTKVTKAGDGISVHYVGTLENGTKFDSSRDSGKPFQFDLGASQVIKGWDQGLVGMKVGEIRKLTIPPSLGYGEQDMGKIPANSTLIFEVELLSIK